MKAGSAWKLRRSNKRVVQHGTRTAAAMAKPVKLPRCIRVITASLLVSKRLLLQAALEQSASSRSKLRRTRSISIYGSARRRSCRPFTATWCITTGTGSGTRETATSAIRVSTKWTSPAGDQGATLPNKVWSVGGRYVPEGPDQGNAKYATRGHEFGDVLWFSKRAAWSAKMPIFRIR